MVNINIKESSQSPEIIFDYEKSTISISGKSYPENVNETYKELLEAIELYKTCPKKETDINFNWLYYNTATTKIIVKIILELKSIDTKLNINWLVKKDFVMMAEKGELMSELMDIEINIVYQK